MSSCFPFPSASSLSRRADPFKDRPAVLLWLLGICGVDSCSWTFLHISSLRKRENVGGGKLRQTTSLAQHFWGHHRMDSSAILWPRDHVLKTGARHTWATKQSWQTLDWDVESLPAPCPTLPGAGRKFTPSLVTIPLLPGEPGSPLLLQPAKTAVPSSVPKHEEENTEDDARDSNMDPNDDPGCGRLIGLLIFHAVTWWTQPYNERETHQRELCTFLSNLSPTLEGYIHFIDMDHLLLHPDPQEQGCMDLAPDVWTIQDQDVWTSAPFICTLCRWRSKHMLWIRALLISRKSWKEQLDCQVL